MRKRLVILCFLLFGLSRFGEAQLMKDNGQLSFSVGPSFPVGQFASKDILSDKAGIASTGGAVSFSYTRLFKGRIGMSVSLTGQINPLDKHSMERSFDQLKMSSPMVVWGTGTGEPTMPPPNGTTYPNWKFKNSSWKMVAFLAGGYGEFKTNSSKIAIISKARIGLVYASSPKIDGSSVTDSTNVHVTQSGKSAFGFGYSLDGGVKIKLSNKIYFHTTLEYFGTNNITFKNVVASVTGVKMSSGQQPNYTTWQSTRIVNGKQTISTLNFLIGVGLQL